jgi:tetratricopeptide (TPR) repeat protein
LNLQGWSREKVTQDESGQRLLTAAADYERAGRLDEAARVYEALLEKSPRDADSWFNLAVLYRRLRNYYAALSAYDRALQCNVGTPEEVHLNRAVIYSDYLQQSDAAEQELTTALQLNPRYIPALLNLANLKEDRGDRTTALATYEKILALDQNHCETLARYANAKTIESSDDPMIARLRTALNSQQANAHEKASLGFALGKALDSAGAYAQAFSAYAIANRESRLSMRVTDAPYDAQRQERLVDELIGAFAPNTPRAASQETIRPIFICGMFRSGSTLAERVLAGHSEVRAGGELDFIPTLVRSLLMPFPTTIRAATPAHMQKLAQFYDEALSRLFPGSARVTDKRPDNFLYIGLIKSMFPNAKIVHTTRNPLDNCLSIYFLHLDHSMSYALNLEDIGHYYAQYRRLMDHWRALYGADILDFSYEAFVREPRSSTERLLQHCSLEFEESCLDLQSQQDAVKTASVWQVRAPIYAHSIGRWRNYAEQLEPLRTYLRERLDGRAVE